MGNASSSVDSESLSPSNEYTHNMSSSIAAGNFNPRVSIQTLGSSLDDGTNQGYYAPADMGDALASSITRDLNPSTIGGQTVAISRLWPGSGRMMRSYRLKIRVPRINTSNNNPDSLPFTIELSCKSFILRSVGEDPLKQVLMEGEAELKRLRSLLSNPERHAHILSYARWIVGPASTNANIVTRTVHLMRQHVHSSLADRLVSRPFLTVIEKNWITYQLLNAIQSLHDVGVCHGHITTENVLLTSWNWVLISDVGCQHYKPVALPDDDPGLWIHWFEGRGGEERGKTENRGNGNGEKKCCLAPERFYSPGKNTEQLPTKLTPAMDTFSLGCVLIEMFLNGERTLDLGDLMEYRRQGEKEIDALPPSLKQKLDKIESSKMRAACRHMLSLDPSARLSTNEYLERLSSNRSSKKNTETGESSTYPPIPDCFTTTLRPFMLRLRTEIQSPDVRIALVAANYSNFLEATVGVVDRWGAAFFERALGPTFRQFHDVAASCDSAELVEMNKNSSGKVEHGGLSNLTLDELLAETEDLLRQLNTHSLNLHSRNKNDLTSLMHSSKSHQLLDDAAKIQHTSSITSPSQASLIIILQVVFSSVRHVRRTSSKFIALKLMHRIALFSSDEIRLERIVPFVTSFLQDSEPIIRALGISILTYVLAMVREFPPSDAKLFPQYVFKKVAHLITDASVIVRVAFARNIATLSETSLRFLDIGHAVSLYDAIYGTAPRDGKVEQEENNLIFSDDTSHYVGTEVSSEKKLHILSDCSPEDTSTALIHNNYDSDLAALHEVVLRWVVHITTDTSDHSSQSKQALLSDLPRLCNFFGSEYSFQILPQILAFFNDRKDWQLRAALCRHLPTICLVVGRAATEQFVVPCIESALNDDEELVVNETLACLSSLISASLLTRTSLLGAEAQSFTHYTDGRPRGEKQGVIKKCAPLLVHPIDSVRRNAAFFVYSCWENLCEIDAYSFAHILQPYLQYHSSFESVQQLISCVKAPVTSTVVNKATVTGLSIDTEVDFSLKMARSLSVPSQWFSEPTSLFIPTWYEFLQRVAQATSKMCDPCFSLGIEAFEQVYGITVPFSSKSPNQQFTKSWIDNLDLPQIAKDDKCANMFLSRPEVMILKSSCRGESGAFALIDQYIPQNHLVLSKVRALSVPCLSPNFGLARSGFDIDVKMKQQWKPKQDALLATTSSTTEHSGAVTKLAVSHDQGFFVSASLDGTSRVFELGQIKESGGDLRSCLTYYGHNIDSDTSSYVRINDVAVLENSHSVASAASDGSLHVWRIDTVTSAQNSSSGQPGKTRVSGNTLLRQIHPSEGEVMAVTHFNTSSASILTYATQRGVIHSTDLRSPAEPFSFDFGPEYGYLTTMEVGKDRSWIAVGSSRGYIGVYDIRFQSLVKLWRHSGHSPIYHLSNACDMSSWPLLFTGCNNNEAILFDASTGDCRQCYRVIEGSLSYIDRKDLPLDCLSMPYFENIKIGKQSISLDAALNMSTSMSSSYNINALVGNISRNGTSHLITGGSDNMIRYWDLGKTTNSFCVAGLSQNQPEPCFGHMDIGRTSRLYICQQPPVPPSQLLASNKLPLLNKQGIVKCDNRHSDAVLDLKVVNKFSICLLSSSRDGTIKIWS